MTNILYEASFEINNFISISTIALIIFIAVFPKIWKNFNADRKTEISYKSVKQFCAVCMVFVLLTSGVAFWGQIHMYKKVVGAYKEGNYKTVEGYVQNFIPMPYAGHSEESFEINGVEFHYSDFSIQSGYNNSKAHGGVIEGNGQHLKIGYVYYNETYGNIIVYIECLD